MINNYILIADIGYTQVRHMSHYFNIFFICFWKQIHYVGQHALKFKTSCSKALTARIKICALTPAECPMRKNRLSANEKA